MFFIPLAKADAAQRLVYGSIDETPDRAREIMDYATAKPAFEAWSEELNKASGGKSYGNIRAQHDAKQAVGLLKSIAFDDDAKRIDFCAHIVDDAAWAKVEAGVFTGFSPGGAYAKRWADTKVTGHFRYTPKVAELSIVDTPCIPTGTFTMVKADGAEEDVEFVLDKAYEPGNEATKDRAEAMAKAADGTTWKDHVAQARADLIAENAAAELAKIAGDEAASEDAASEGHGGISATDKLDAALEKADAALAVISDAVSPAAFYAGALTGALLKCDTELEIAPPSPEAVALIGADMTKSFAALDVIRAAAEPVLAKGLYDLTDVVKTLQSMSWIAQCVTDEASWERDNSPLPQMAIDLVTGLKAFLIAMVEEEVSEMLVRTKASGGDVVSLIIEGDDEEMELARQIVDLAKASPRLEKAGARNSKGDAERIQTIHDKAAELGAACAHDEEAVAKAASLTEERDRLAKSVDKALPAVEKLTEQVNALRTERDADREEMAKMAAQIEELGGQPAPTKIQLAVAHSKEQDNGSLAKDADDDDGIMTLEKASKLEGPARSQALELIAMQHRARR